jgi:fructose-1-phosphate kinase PfkB-like protein
MDEQMPMATSQVEGETRLAITVTERGGGDTVINGPGPRARGDRWAEHVRTVADGLRSHRPAYFVIAGRPPLDVDVADVRELIMEATAVGARTILDMASPILEQCLPLEPWLVKINTHEARAATGKGGDGFDLSNRLVNLGAQNAVITDGPGRVACRLLGMNIEGTPPQVNAVSAVGCGDSLLAGLISGLTEHSLASDAPQLIRRAIGAGSAAAEDLRPGFFVRSRAAQLEQRVEIRVHG